MTRQDIEEHQLKKLIEQVTRCYEKSSHYRRKFDSVGLKPQDIKSLDDLQKIPFTVKND